MKKLIIIVNVFLFATTVNAQQVQPLFTNNPFPKTITISGSAEMEIIPDEIYVNVELKEYQKRGEYKKDIETIKTQFLEVSKAAGIPDSLISIVSFAGNNPYFWKKRKKDPDLFAGITYQIKFKSSELMDKLVEKLDDDATQSFLIVSTSHSKITEYRKQLKIAAVKAAKEKGIYLTEAVGERLGEAITIKEPDENNIIRTRGYYGENQNLFGAVARSSQGRLSGDTFQADDTIIDFKKMKVRFEVEVVFALK
jgi:uncharacterized protein YggE